ncbi:MAG: bifunctional phosphoribosyl-AMP cyclohydrolase/phosphoribosyl-ATP diphosphatase HisIE [Burkholderiaceae bacterium]
MSVSIDQVRFDAQGLVPAIVQDRATQRVLMVAHMNREALSQTIASGQAVFFSRSRGKLWRKGESSGHTQTVHEVRIDCDGDVILLQVTQTGGIACHTGRASCFYSRWEPDGWRVVDPVLKDPDEIYARNPATTAAQSSSTAASVSASALAALTPAAADAGPTGQTEALCRLADVIDQRRLSDPEKSYVARLLQRAPDAVLKKIGEEATETVMACKDGQAERIVSETADLWFHCLVMLAQYGLRPEQVIDELVRREGLSGLDEKAARKAQARGSRNEG